MNFWDILILLIVAGVIVLALRVMRGKGKTGGCSCGCSGCAKDCAARQEEKSKTNGGKSAMMKAHRQEVRNGKNRCAG